ncbi:Hypothetical protein Bdt_0717 [Bdellovibrio bacteriovorus str. Tiberius]|uniref:Uncharacterized protein n=1 Tax=Bdellovibrio bacteriovorus str. Tiberius TaxID=1069642 RepID=K7Z7V4_BDEBC|nr:Hypothetical protein Bdt_0717 [Bdellovibrio bacteriovorus str. Tiberius]
MAGSISTSTSSTSDLSVFEVARFVSGCIVLQTSITSVDVWTRAEGFEFETQRNCVRALCRDQ